MKIAIVAGEASGDLHASEVVHELKKLDPSLETFGLGGDLLARQGTVLLHHVRELGIVGLFNVLRHLPMFRRIFRELVDRIVAEKPDAVVLVDYPGFNLRLAKRCKELGLKVIYFISPQVWAWHTSRVRHIRKYVDRMIVIFPFEEEFYRGHGVPVTYAGNPLIEQLSGVRKPARTPDRLRLALLPGSRKHEVRSLMPAMLDAVRILRQKGAVDAYVIQAPTIAQEKLEKIMRQHGVEVPIVPHDRGEGLAAADIALASSGTATLEAAVIGTPCVVMYRLSRATHFLGRRLVKLPHWSLVNIIAGKEVVPELIQDDVNGARIADEVRRMTEPATYARLTEELAQVRAKLGEPGAARRVAEEIHKMVAG
ncbi:MAG TPA: lipid-A-disaccharide synthase [Thermoanaerobaculia bacterium]|nr:lipid-A-disaccharide synthase [Thermoanaerobaculia bacterium]